MSPLAAWYVDFHTASIVWLQRSLRRGPRVPHAFQPPSHYPGWPSILTRLVLLLAAGTASILPDVPPGSLRCTCLNGAVAPEELRGVPGLPPDTAIPDAQLAALVHCLHASGIAAVCLLTSGTDLTGTRSARNHRVNGPLVADQLNLIIWTVQAFWNLAMLC